MISRLRELLVNEKRFIALLRSSFIVRGAGTACGFIMHVLLSRTLGAEGAGIFYLALSLMMAGGVIGKFGLDTALMKFAGTAADQGAMDKVRGYYFVASQFSALLSLLATVLLFLSAPWLAHQVFGNPELAIAIQVLSLAILPFSLVWIQSGILKAIGRPVAATLVESALIPFFMASALILLFVIDDIGVTPAVLSYLVVTLLVAAIGAWIFRGSNGGRGARAAVQKRELARECTPLALIDMMNFLLAWAIFPILGSVAAESEVGIFNAAHKLAIQFSIIMVVFGGIISPQFAALYSKNDLAGLERAIKNSTFFMALSALPLAILLLGWPQVVGLIFGPEFADGEIVLRVLVIGQLVNLITGPCGYVLVMTGHQATMRNVLLVTLVITLPAIWYLGKTHGAVGAAAAMSVGLALQNIFSAFFVYRYLGILAIPLYSPKSAN